MATITETFPGADQAAVAGDHAWTEVIGTFERFGNAVWLRTGANQLSCAYINDATLDSGDQQVIGTLAAWADSGGTGNELVAIGPLLRHPGTGVSTGYGVRAIRSGSTLLWDIYKIKAGVETQLLTNAQDPVLNDSITFRVTTNGANVDLTLIIGSTTLMTYTDTGTAPEGGAVIPASNHNVGIIGFINLNTQVNAALDNLTYEDYGVASTDEGDDVALIGLTDASRPPLTLTSTSDALFAGLTEAFMLTESLPASDTLLLGLTELTVAAVSFSTSDTLPLGLSEATKADIAFTASDALHLGLTEFIRNDVTFTTSDSLLLGLTELTKADVSFSTPDSLLIGLLEASAVADLTTGTTTVASSDLLSIGLIESPVIFATAFASDTLPVTADEAVRIDLTAQASESIPLGLQEAAVVSDVTGGTFDIAGSEALLGFQENATVIDLTPTPAPAPTLPGAGGYGPSTLDVRLRKRTSVVIRMRAFRCSGRGRVGKLQPVTIRLQVATTVVSMQACAARGTCRTKSMARYRVAASRSASILVASRVKACAVTLIGMTPLGTSGLATELGTFKRQVVKDLASVQDELEAMWLLT